HARPSLRTRSPASPGRPCLEIARAPTGNPPHNYLKSGHAVLPGSKEFPPVRSGDPTLSAAERISSACDRFESEWQSCQRPRADGYVAAAPESDREILRGELAAIERELRGGRTGTSRRPASHGFTSPDATAVYAKPTDDASWTIGRFEVREVLGRGA